MPGPSRRRARRWGLIVLCLLIAVVAVRARGQARAESPLSVVLATPKGDVRELYSIDASFSEPMVKIGERGHSGRNVFRIEPKLKGSITWLGTRAVSFVLEQPPADGTEIHVTIPKGTKSLAGAELKEEVQFTIDFRRPRLLASVPAPAPIVPESEEQAPEVGIFPIDDPILLVFDQKPAGGERAVSLWRWSGEDATSTPDAVLVPLRSYSPTESELTDLADRLGKESIDRAKVIGVKTTTPLDPNQLYQVRLAKDLRFEGSELGLADEVHILFRTLGAPGVREVTADRGSLLFTMGSPTHPDTLLKYLKLDPPVKRLSAWEGGGQNIWVEGPLPSGHELRVTVPAGLPDLYGRRTNVSFTDLVTVPHDWATLEIEPDAGAMMPGPDEAVRVKAINTIPVEIRGMWLKSSDGPLASTRLSTYGSLLSQTKNPASWSTRWFKSILWSDPSTVADSTYSWRKRLDELPARPADGDLLYLEATSIARFPEPDQPPDTLRAYTLLQITSIGITSRLAREHGLLWVTDLSNGKPIVGARVSLWDGPDALGKAPAAPLWKGTTDADGIAWTPGVATLTAAGVPRFALCETKNDRAFLELSIYDWNLEELRNTPPPAAALWTDRPIYRPGDRVEWKIWLREVDAKGLSISKRKNVEVRLNGYDDAAQKAQLTLSANGTGAGHFVLPQNARTGRYALEVFEPSPDDNGRQLGVIGLDVEEYRAPRFQAKVTASPRLLLSGGTATAEGLFRYYSGGALGGQPVDWFLSLSPAYWRPQGWAEFNFSDDPPVTIRPSDGGYQRKRGYQGPTVLRQGKAQLDRDGRIVLEQSILLPPEAPDSYASFEIGARDLADQSAFDNDGVTVVRGPLRVGVRTLWDEPTERTNQVSWEWVVVDTAGTIRADVPVVTELWRQDYKTARVRRLGGLFDYENFPADTLISRLERTSASEVTKQIMTVPGPGDYRLRVYPKVPNGELLGGSASAWVAGSEVSNAPRPTTWWLNLDLETSDYAPDDTVRVVIPAPVGGAEALVVLQSGEIIRAKHVALSGTPRVEVPLLGLAPGSASIDAVLVGPDKVPTQPGQGPRQFLPYHARANAYFNVGFGKWEAKLSVTPTRTTVEPGDSLGVDFLLTDAAGNPSAGEITLAVVDEAVLALLADNTVHPLTQLFGSRHGSVIEDDLRTQLRLSPSLDKGKSSPGGGGAEAKMGLPTRANFRATAYWNPLILASADGRAHVTIPMPDDLTRYRLRAIGMTTKSEFAQAESTVTVARSLEVEAAAPRFVRIGDAWSLGAVVRNRTTAPMDVDLRCEVTGARLTGPSSTKRKLAPGENWRADFAVESPSTGTLRYTLTASADGGRLLDRVSRNLLVKDALHHEIDVAFGVAAPKGQETISLADPGLMEGGGLSIAVSPTLLNGLAPALEYLTGYPHGCLEQIDSQLFGWLAKRELADRLPPDSIDADAINARLVKGVEKIGAQYGADGFRLWPEGGSSSPYLNAYTYWILSRVARAGITVPEELLAGADQLLANDLERTKETALDPDTQAFLAWVRLEGATAEPPVDDATLERLYTYPEELGTAGKIALALAYDRYEERRRATGSLRKTADADLRMMASGHIKALIDAAAEGVERSASSASLEELHPGWGAAFGSSRLDRVRATALATLLLSRRDPNHPLLPLFVRWLMTERKHGRWANTHENAWAVASLMEYAKAAENLRLPIEARLTLGLARPEGMRFEAGKLAPFTRRYTLDELLKVRRDDPSSKDLVAAFETGGQQPVFYDLRLDRYVPALRLQPREEGMVVFREYTSIDGQPLVKLRRGDPVLTHLAIVVPQAASYLVVEDPLPAGLEAVNLDFKISSRTLYREEEPILYDYEVPEEPDEEGGEMRFPVSARSLLDDRARFYADDIPAGVYHLYYPVTPTTAGRFGTPGARAELLYSPEVYAVSGAEVVTVE